MRWTQDQLDAFKARMNASAGVDSKLVRIAQQATLQKPKRSKYGNVKVTDAAGAVHDSGKEYRRWCDLELRERAGDIRSLRRQVPYALVVNGRLICQYIADFVYVDGSTEIVEDVKSPATRTKPEYRIKLKLMEALHGVQIREV